ncbi:MAG: ArsR family transcriptional regulator [Methanoregula sp.]
MRTQKVTYFTDKEEAFTNLFVGLGTKRNVAIVLVYLANMQEATSRDIERSNDLRQPEVSLAMKYLIHRGWITVRDDASKSKGRPLKIYALAKPFAEIIRIIEDEKKAEAEHKIQLTKKLRDYI